jgi:crotonobetainyl-CoA:carnitine CoA-transferase CaiB-like acyl-CoA transferase
MAKQPFEGVKVADFAWAAVGPFPCTYLASYGATVVRVESAKRPDPVRSSGPYKDGIPGINRSGLNNQVQINKYGLSLDLNHPRGREVARKLIGWADVVAQSFTPGVMAKWGLGYEDVKKFKPDIIYYSTCMMGQYGPYAPLPGFGTLLTAMSGFALITGWPDRIPVVVPGANTDYMNVWLAITTIIAALNYRRRTGKGQHLDLSQYEGAAHWFAPAILDYAANGREMKRNGNRDPIAAPHGVYRCQGNDCWCAIAVFSDEEWQAFCRVLGNPGWTKKEKFATLQGRKENEEELDGLVERWTTGHTAQEVMKLMQAGGVPAGSVLNTEGTFDDPQLQLREVYVEVNHPEIGLHHAYNFGGLTRLSRVPFQVKMPSPCIGEHNEYVCTDLLGMSDEEFVQLMSEGAFD